MVRRHSRTAHVAARGENFGAAFSEGVLGACAGIFDEIPVIPLTTLSRCRGLA